MRRLLCLLVVLPVVTACGAVARSLPPAHAASPQRAELGWKERLGDATGGLEFSVDSFEVTRDGWRARVSIANQTDVPFLTGGTRLLGPPAYGVMLFSTGAHSELDDRNATNSLPTIRHAERFEPALPAQLGAGETWTGTISARGPLAAGTWVRIVFGPLAVKPASQSGSTDAPAPKLPAPLGEAHADQGVAWITDHAYELRR